MNSFQNCTYVWATSCVKLDNNAIGSGERALVFQRIYVMGGGINVSLKFLPRDLVRQCLLHVLEFLVQAVVVGQTPAMWQQGSRMLPWPWDAHAAINWKSQHGTPQQTGTIIMALCLGTRESLIYPFWDYKGKTSSINDSYYITYIQLQRPAIPVFRQTNEWTNCTADASNPFETWLTWS